MQQQQKTHPTLQDGTLNSELDSSVNQSNCLSPIKAGKLSNMLLKESIEGSVFSNAIKVKACMPNFKSVAKKAERRASFEYTSTPAPPPDSKNAA